jgi:3-oxoadipate enol-lactonase
MGTGLPGRMNLPEAFANGHRVHYELQGAVGAPVVVLSNSLGTTLAMWDQQVPSLIRQFRVLRYDTRGHGSSEIMRGDYQIEQLGSDVLDLTAVLGIDEFSFCGLSMGGLIGQWLALHGGKRLRQVVLCNTAAKIGDENSWNARIARVRRDGLADIAQEAIARWFTSPFAIAEPARVEVIKRLLVTCDPAGYAANCAAVRDADFRSRLGEINKPALVIAGASDPVTTLAECQALAAGIRGAKLAVMNAAHLSNFGDERFNSVLTNFLVT